MTLSRLPALDGLRGIAVMGIAVMNLVAFAQPSGAYFNPLAWGPASSPDLWAWSAAFVLVDGKMRALFTILFGAGMAILASRAEAADENARAAHHRRMAALGAIGLAHGVLLWPGDILLHYALVGWLAWPLLGLPPRQQLVLAVLLLAGQALVQAIVLLNDIAVREAGGPAWRSVAAAIGVAPAAALRPEIALRLGDWPALAAANAREMAMGVPFTLSFNGLETMALMALGMAATATGLLHDTWRPYRAAAAALLSGLTLGAALAAAVARGGFDTIAAFAAATLGGIALRPVVALGYATLLLPRLGGDGRLARRLQAVGRMTLSNYLATSLAMTFLFDGWGLGLFARLSRLEVYALAPALWLAMLAWSAPWLARFRLGPAEWAWRSLAAGRALPLRRSQAIASV